MWNSAYGSVFAQAERSAYISVFVYPQSSEQRLLAAQIKITSFSLTSCVCVVYICVCVFFECMSMPPCAFVCVHACFAVMPARRDQPRSLQNTYSALFFSLSLLLFSLLSPCSLHFRVLLDRTTLATGNSPLSTLHPKACGFWKPECVCVWVGTCACCALATMCK